MSGRLRSPAASAAAYIDQGNAYMAAIRPFRYLIVYPVIMQEMGRRWRAATGSAPSLGAPT